MVTDIPSNLSTMKDAAALLLAGKGDRVISRAKGWIEAVREDHGIPAAKKFMQAHGFDTREGLALMCLAESLLRIPDDYTADLLIKDKLGDLSWKHEVVEDAPAWLSAADMALKAASNILGHHSVLAAVGEPVIRKSLKTAMRQMGGIFVLAETIETALMRREANMLYSYDMLGEGARTAAQAEEFFKRYMHAIEAIAAQEKRAKDCYANDSISVKLSALHPKFQLVHYNRLKEELLPRIKALAKHAVQHNVMLTIDAEESYRLDLTLLVFEEICRDPHLTGFNGLGIAVQAYNIRAREVIEQLIALAKETGRLIPVRLVKGAYWDSEIKWAQTEGLKEYPVFTSKAQTDISYLACASLMLEQPEAIYPQFATHNAFTLSALYEQVDKPADGEFQRLHGMGTRLYKQVVKEKRCRVYAPVGEHEALLPYLIRRLLENGANTSFVKHLTDPAVPVSYLLTNPLDAEVQAFALPPALYGDRKNSLGVDLGKVEVLEAIGAPYCTRDLIARAQEFVPHSLVNGKPKEGENLVNSTIENAQEGFAQWRYTTAEERTKVLEHAADLLEARTQEAVALCIDEAGKTLKNAIGEVREAVDFLRYYAKEAHRLFGAPQELKGPAGEHNTHQFTARGIFVCISPWNFPLAIFTGQIAAALASGNAVIAKPAEPTPRIAFFMTKLLHEAGVPANVLHLLLGKGSSVGAELVRDRRIGGVCFTGSTATARFINQQLADREGAIIPFIAETGGQNCMIIDSSALLEQAVDDVIMSAFDSAGQRCSALRVVYVQTDIFDRFSTLLKGAIMEIRVGDPHEVDTDIGPVINEQAKTALEDHILRMEQSNKLIAKGFPPVDEKYPYVIPHAFEIKNIEQLPEEVFGPILHVIRFNGKKFNTVIDHINSTGYGLTFGIHTRIDSRIAYVSEHIHAGNIYANRSMIGATVGVQPFGGQGLSGTGPKAGGPYYLPRFCHERVVSNNIAAIGGNVELLG